jgi:hypothetical protein
MRNKRLSGVCHPDLTKVNILPCFAIFIYFSPEISRVVLNIGELVGLGA